MKKFIAVIMGLIITAGIVCGFGFVSRRDGKWFQESDMSKWHIKNENPDNTDNSEEQTGVVAYTSDGEALEAGGSYAMPVAYTYLGSRSEEQGGVRGNKRLLSIVKNPLTYPKYFAIIPSVTN